MCCRCRCCCCVTITGQISFLLVFCLGSYKKIKTATKRTEKKKKLASKNFNYFPFFAACDLTSSVNIGINLVWRGRGPSLLSLFIADWWFILRENPLFYRVWNKVHILKLEQYKYSKKELLQFQREPTFPQISQKKKRDSYFKRGIQLEESHDNMDITLFDLMGLLSFRTRTLCKCGLLGKSILKKAKACDRDTSITESFSLLWRVILKMKIATKFTSPLYHPPSFTPSLLYLLFFILIILLTNSIYWVYSPSLLLPPLF